MEVSKGNILKKVNIAGEIMIYLFVFSMFIDSKLTMKIGYILQGLSLIKIGLDYKNIKLKGKEIYLTFIIILIIGIIFNFLSTNGDGVNKFIDRNLKFFNGIMLILFIDNWKKLKNLLYIIVVGSLLLSFDIINNSKYIKLDFIRKRGILTVATGFTISYWLEILKNYKNKKKWGEIIICFFINLYLLKGVGYSDSRMGFLVIIGTVGIYLLYIIWKLKFDFKKIVGIFLAGCIISSLFYVVAPPQFKSKIKTSFQTKNNFSNEARLIMWQGSLDAFYSSPIIGVGSAVSDTQPFVIKAAEKMNRSKNLNDAFIRRKAFGEAHSIYFNFLSQTGLLIIGYLYLLFYLIPKRFLKSQRNEILSGCFFGGVCFLLYGITWSVWGYYGVVQNFFQILLSMMIVASELKKEEF